MATNRHQKFYSRFHVTCLHNFLKFVNFDHKYLKKVSVKNFRNCDVFDQGRAREYEYEVKTRIGSSIPAVLAINQIFSFFRFF